MNDAVDGVRAYLEANLEAALVTIETAYGVTIPRLVQVDTADIKSRRFPALEILPETTDPDYRDDEGPLDFEAWDIHRIILLLSQVGSDPKAIEYTLMYYRKAFMRIVRADNTFGHLFNRVRLGQSQYWPMVKSQETGELLQVLKQLVDVRVLQV